MGSYRSKNDIDSYDVVPISTLNMEWIALAC
jgi:hypothetical protein